MGKILSEDRVFAVLHTQPQETSNYPEASRTTLLGLILIIQVYKKKRKRKKLNHSFCFWQH